MKLFFIPGTCALSPHIVLHELDLPFTPELVDRQTKKLASGKDYLSVNPKGLVPAIETDQGDVLTEAAVIVQYLADLKPEKKLLPPPGTFERVRVQEWLNYIATEIHKGHANLFNPKAGEDLKTLAREALGTRFSLIVKRLEGKSFLMGEQFTVADAYLFTVLTWGPRAGLDLGNYPTLKAYFERIKARPAVQAALQTHEKARAQAQK